MKALTFRGRETISWEDIPDPRIEHADDAIVRVHRTAICGSDLHVYHERERGILPGTAMGHEFSGEIVELGKTVDGLGVGDVVVAPFTTNCNDCFYCHRGLSARCEKGQLFGWRDVDGGLHGGQAELVRVPLASTTLVRLASDEDHEIALFFGDVLATGFFCAQMAGVQPGQSYAILGCGPVGLAAILCATTLGADRLFAFDSVARRLALAESFGAQPVDFTRDEQVAAMFEQTEGRGVDGVLELVGSPAASRLAFDIVRPGGVIGAAGVHTEPQFAFSPVEAYDKNLTYRAGRCSARQFMDAARSVALKHSDDVRRIISHRFPMSDGPRAYDMFARRIDGCTKVVLTP